MFRDVNERERELFQHYFSKNVLLTEFTTKNSETYASEIWHLVSIL